MFIGILTSVDKTVLSLKLLNTKLGQMSVDEYEFVAIILSVVSYTCMSLYKFPCAHTDVFIHTMTD